MPSAWDALSHLGFAGRPDSSGVRGGLKRPLIKRNKNFPFDRDDPDQMYGNPQAYDRGSNVGGALHKPLTPKKISDDDAENMGFKVKVKLEKLTDEELDEVLGSPMLLGKAGSSQMGNAIPGVGSGWAKNPPKDWDDEDFSKMEKPQLERILAKLQIAMPATTRESPLQVNPAPNPDVDLGPGDDEPETEFERRMAMLVVGPDSYIPGTQGNRLSSRGTYGMMPKESAWDGLKNIFGSR